MAIEVRESRGVYLISGELNLVSAEQFRHWMEPVLDASGEIVLDLAGVTFIDSIGLRSITLLAKMIGDRGATGNRRTRRGRRDEQRVTQLTRGHASPG
jgi:anti-anti-sigma factor